MDWNEDSATCRQHQIKGNVTSTHTGELGSSTLRVSRLGESLFAADDSWHIHTNLIEQFKPVRSNELFSLN